VYLEDFIPGRVDDLGIVSVDAAEVIEFARRYDPQPYHLDEVAARNGPFGGLTASGWQTCALVMRAIVDNYLDPHASLGSPGVDQLRWLVPVRPGDHLRVQVTVLSSRVSASKPDRGIAVTEVEARNQDDLVVIRQQVTHIVRRRSIA
jgi:acyl dehydratase